MEEQKSPLIPEREFFRAEKNEKRRYLAPTMGAILVELESHIAAGSITVTQENQEVQEGWMEDEIVRDIEIDLF